MTLSIRRRTGSVETESSYMLHNNSNNNFIGRSPGFLPHHQGSSAFGGGNTRSHGVSGGFAANNDSTSTMMTRGRTSFNICLGLGVILLIFPWVPSFMATYYKTVSLRDEYASLQLAHKNLVTELKGSVDTRRTLTDQTKTTEEMNKNLLLALKDYGDNIDPDNNVYAMAEEVEEAYVTRIDDLESVISLWSERKLREKYGETKERLRFAVTLSESVGDDANGKPQTSFVMETARLDQMPYSINFFQQMVQDTLCDGLAMTAKKDPAELIQVQMDGTNVTAATSGVTALTSNRSQTLLFTERSPENPLDKYSVSFGGGRSASENFALQGQHGLGFVVHMHQNKVGSALQENAYDIESAFAKVVEGQQLLDSIMDSNRTITIKSIRPVA